MVYRFLVNCVLPVNQKHGFESMGVYEEMAIRVGDKVGIEINKVDRSGI
jgi:hypothetical protein